jgi:hypothetical protein
MPKVTNRPSAATEAALRQTAKFLRLTNDVIAREH